MPVKFGPMFWANFIAGIAAALIVHEILKRRGEL